jgi:glycosyltransferase involved in cell wall biosynthesis
MNILFYDSIKNKELENQYVHVFEVLNNLSNMGHSIIYADGGRHNQAEIKKEGSLYSKVTGHQSLRSRAIHFLVSSSFRGEVLLFFFFLGEVKLFFSALRNSFRQKPSIVYRRSSQFNSDYFLARLLRVPSIKEVNGIIADEARITQRGDSFSLKIINALEKFTLPKADKIIVVTSRLKEVLQGDYGVPEDKIVVIPNGANTDLFKPIDAIEAREELGLRGSDNYICFVGSLVQWQGVEYLIKSVPLILKQCPETRFLIVGDGPMKQELIELAEKIGISANVIFTGMVPYQKVPLYVNASDVCVLPKKPMRTGYSPLKLCEYMACMKPVVATRTDGFEILEEFNAGALMNPENPSEFAQAIIKLLQDPDLRVQMGQNGRKYVVENRSWESVAKRVADVCEAAIMSYRRK